MPTGRSSNGASAHLPVLVDTRIIKALDHVLRQHILLAAVQGEVSPSGLSKTLGEGLSQVSYHVKVLRDDCDGMIEETRREPRRGAVEHYYRARAKTLLPAKAWRRLKKGLRAAVGASQASDLFNDLAEALEAGKLQGRHDHIARTPLVLDAEGQRNVKAIAERVTGEVEDEQRAAAKRMEDADADSSEAVGYIFALLAFEAAWGPAALRAAAARAEDAPGAASNGANRTSPGRGMRRNRLKAGTTGK